MIVNFEQLLKQYLKDDSNSHVNHMTQELIIRDYKTIMSDGLIFQITIEDMCSATGYDDIEINLTDLLVWIYNNEKN